MAEYIVRETGYPGAVKQEVVGELVRCKDCRWWTQANAMHWGHCELSNGVCPDGDWFCADGERKDDEAD